MHYGLGGSEAELMPGHGSGIKFYNDSLADLTEADEELFYRFNPVPSEPLPQDKVRFEDSYEYIRLYFDSGDWHGQRYYDGDTLIFLAHSGRSDRPASVRYKIFKPLGSEPVQKLYALLEHLKGSTDKQITVTCLPVELANDLEGFRKKQFRYLIYNVESISDLSGGSWKNVRQKLTKFKREHGKVRIDMLSKANREKVVHFISSWRREALNERGFSYAQVEKAKFAARYYSDKMDTSQIWAYVYYIEGRVSGFQLLYRLGPNAAANPIGLADISIDGMAEYSQVHAWTEAAGHGLIYINDGPSWRRSLEQFKSKFNPISEQLVFEFTI
jgi:hypothetical protein